MNRFKRLVVLVSLVAAGAANAALDPISNVVELAYDQAPVPAHEADRVTLVPCVGCQPVTVRFSTATRYRPNGFASSGVTLTELNQIIRQVDDKGALLFYVRYSAETLLVSELVMTGAE